MYDSLSDVLNPARLANRGVKRNETERAQNKGKYSMKVGAIRLRVFRSKGEEGVNVCNINAGKPA